MPRKKTTHQTAPFKVWVKPSVHDARKQWPGHIRQRLLRALDELAVEARPSDSRPLDVPQTLRIKLAPGWEVRRIRLDEWRIVYAVNDQWHEVAVLTIQRRPPYDYADLEALLADL